MAQFLQYLRSGKGRYYFAVFVVIILGWGALRGCSHGSLLVMSRYTVAVDRSWYPLPLYGKEKNLLAFVDELLEEIGAESGIGFTLIETGTPNLLRDLDNGGYDAVVTSKPPTHVNMVKYHFSDPIYMMGPVIVVRTESTVKTLDDLASKFVGIRRGLPLAFDSPLPSANIIPYDNMTIGLADLEDNKIDALIMDSLLAYVQIQGIYVGKVKIVTAPLSQEGLRLMTLHDKRYDEFLTLFNKSLKTLQENGKYEELLSRWGLFNPVIKNEHGAAAALP